MFISVAGLLFPTHPSNKLLPDITHPVSQIFTGYLWRQESKAVQFSSKHLNSGIHIKFQLCFFLAV